MALSTDRLAAAILQGINTAEQVITSGNPVLDPKVVFANAIALAIKDEILQLQIDITANAGLLPVTVQSIVLS